MILLVIVLLALRSTKILFKALNVLGLILVAFLIFNCNSKISFIVCKISCSLFNAIIRLFSISSSIQLPVHVFL